MVMVTKTKVAELPSDDVDDNHTTTSSTDATTYVTQSESLLVTPTCLQRVEKLIRQRQEKENSTSQGFFLRVFVDAGGCSGFQYQFEIDHELDEEDGDIVIVSASADDTLHPRIVIDETSLGFLEGATLDYVVEMIKSAFVVRDNPKSESACGCGSSFAMKNFTANPAMD
jgi:iron-sulfur cluster assembly accessory protein